MTDNKKTKNLVLGGTEKISIIAILLFVLVSLLLQQKQIAVGIGVGGALFILDFIGIKIIVNSIMNKKHSLGFSIFLFIIKFVVLLAILFTVLVFTKLNIYGFIIALTVLVLIIVVRGLKGVGNGTF